MNRLTLEERKRANKIRCKLLYTIDRDIRETKKTNKNKVLINSMTLQEIEDKFLLFPNYKMKLSTTFTKIANKYMVMQSYDKNLNTKFYYTDYLQDQKKVNHCIVKLERKRISANNIIKIPLLVETQDVQSPIPEIFTNKMNIGDKKNIKPKDNNNILSIINNNKKYGLNEMEERNNDEIIKKKIDNITNKEKSKSKKINININIKDDDSSLSSITLELIQKKANFLSASLNKKNKKEIKRRRKQLEAIKKLRQFCYEKLRNKRRCVTKSSHQNLLYINKKFDDENEKNNSNYSSKNNIKIKRNNNIKTSTRNNMRNIKNNSKKKYDSLFESKRKRTPKKNKEKRKFENSTARKVHKNDSSKKSPVKVKRVTHERKSLVLQTNIISGKLDMDILRFKKRKKEKNNNSIEEDMPKKSNNYNLYFNYNTNGKSKKKKTGILRESFKDRPRLFNNNKNNILISVRVKNKNNNVIFNDQDVTKRNSSSNNFFNRKNRTNKFNTISSRNLFKQLTKFKIRKTSGSKSERRSRCSSPGKPDKSSYYAKKESKSEKSLNVEKFKDIKTNYNKYIHKERNVFHSIKQRNSQNWNKSKNEMQKVVEEDD